MEQYSNIVENVIVVYRMLIFRSATRADKNLESIMGTSKSTTQELPVHSRLASFDDFLEAKQPQVKNVEPRLLFREADQSSAVAQSSKDRARPIEN